MKSSPLLSIVMPNYNKGSFIQEAIESVLNQSYKNWELIIVDNGSTDISHKIINKYRNEDRRIKYFECQSLKNPGAVRNKGLSHATGDFLAFLDSDDLWLPEKLEKQLDYMTQQNATICTTYTQIIDKNGYSIGHYHPKKKLADFQDMLIENFISTSATMLDWKECSYLCFPSLRHCQDYAGWLTLLEAGHSVCIMPESLTQYRIEKSFYLFRKIPKAFFRWKIYRKHLGFSFFKAFAYFGRYAFNGLQKSKNYISNNPS